MKNYYSILGILSTANVADIKSAYKKLAKQYHPDKNPGNAAAEEKFKLINEAYHTLIDYSKRSLYDAQLQRTTQHQTEYKKQAHNNPRYHKQRQQKEQQYYKVDKTYFKTQALTLLVFIAIAGFCLIIVQAFRHFNNQKKAEHFNSITIALHNINALFISGKTKEAFFSLQQLQEKEPLELRLGNTFDSLLIKLRLQAQGKYEAQQFSSAIVDYFVIEEYEKPKRMETTLKIAQCQYALENYNEALVILKQIDNEHPNDLELIYEISLIYLNDLHDAENALQYLSKGKKIIEQSSMEKDGTSFQFTISMSDAPTLYLEIFEARSEANIAMENFTDAIEDCNLALYLKPDNIKLYKSRAISNIGLGKGEAACADLKKAKQLGAEDIDELVEKYCH